MRRLRGPAPPPKYIMDSTTRLTIPEASRLLGIPLGTLRNRVARGGMPHYSIDGYHVLVDLADIVAWEPVWASGSRRGENARRVVALVVQGYSDRSIAATLAISFQRVSQLRRRAGLTPAHRKAHGTLCLKCGARFVPERRGQNRCPEHRRKSTGILTFTCLECAAPFQRRESTIRPTSPGRYCSRACRNQGRRGQSRTDSVTKSCTRCGRDYQGLLSAKQSVCRTCRPKGASGAKALRKQQG